MKSKIICSLGLWVFAVMTFCDANGMNNQEWPAEQSAGRLAPGYNNDQSTTAQVNKESGDSRWRDNEEFAKRILEGSEERLKEQKRRLKEIIDHGKTLEPGEVRVIAEELSHFW